MALPPVLRPADMLAEPAAAQEPESLPPVLRPADLPSQSLEQLERPGPTEPLPPVLRPPLADSPQPAITSLPPGYGEALLRIGDEAPLGFTGPSSVLPSETQQNSHFVPIEDRWRIGFPQWDRYGNGHPPLDDYPFVEGRWLNPYTQNVLKGDYPLIGQQTFLKLTLQSQSLLDARQTPLGTTPFESTAQPGQAEFFGDPDQLFTNQNFVAGIELFHGEAAFRPADWRIRVAPVFNMNHLVVDELGVVRPDVRAGTGRFRTDFALEEWFAEVKLADLGVHYDFVSLRAGSQLFVSDFRGLLFADINRAVRLFGTRLSNREQFNLVWFDQTEKDTNSLLNTFDDRGQTTVIANYYRQDTVWPGYDAQLSFHFNHDRPTVEFDKNDFLVRPDPVGIFAPHDIKSYYFGWTGNGHVDRYNVSHALYYVFGRDDLNPLAGRPQRIDAWMGALELSYDRDWVRFRTSYFFASGDSDIGDGRASGFDAIFDRPAFAGGDFSFWNRQMIRLFGVNVVQRQSLVPNLRSSKFQGQTNFVNPGLHLVNFGADADLTPRLKLIGNTNLLWFHHTEVLEQFVFQGDIDNFIGVDVSLGGEWRPRLNNNVIVKGGGAALLTGQGFADIYNPLRGESRDLFAGFLECVLEY